MTELKVVWRRPPVACADCGYLCYYRGEKSGEVPPSVRRADAEHAWRLENVACFKHASDLFGGTGVPRLGKPDQFGHDSVDQTAARAALARKHDCRFFYRYRPGYDAALHRDLQDQERRDNAARLWNGVFALLGGVLAILGTAVALLLT